MSRLPLARPLADDVASLLASGGGGPFGRNLRAVAPLCATCRPSSREPRRGEAGGPALGVEHLPLLLKGFAPGAGTPSRRSVSCAARQGRKGRQKGPRRAPGNAGGASLGEDPEAVEAALEELFLELARDLELGEGADPGALDIGGEDLTEEEMLALEQELNDLLGPEVQHMLDDPEAHDAAAAYLGATDKRAEGDAPAPGFHEGAKPSGSLQEGRAGVDPEAVVAPGKSALEEPRMEEGRAGEDAEAVVAPRKSALEEPSIAPQVLGGGLYIADSRALHSKVEDTESVTTRSGSSYGAPISQGGAPSIPGSAESVQHFQEQPTGGAPARGRARTVAIQEWQLKKLVKALRQGRRHVNVKALAAELKMDRRDVLTWLRNPPPEAVQLAATGEAWLAPARNRVPPVPVTEGKVQAVGAVPGGLEEGTPAKDRVSGTEPSAAAEDAGDGERWERGGKRIGREQLATLEAVFQRTRHPTGTMIASLVSLTNLPRRRIVQWFSERREEAARKQTSAQSKPSSAWKAL